MLNTIRKEDLRDADIVDQIELKSDGYSNNSSYLTSSVISTNNISKEIEINLPADGEDILYSLDHPAQKNDLIYLYNTSGADGYYTINNITENLKFTVNENINSSTGGNIIFFHPAGATLVGFDPRNSINIHHNEVQGALEDLDQAIENININSLPIANECGQLLISEDDNTFKPHSPLINDNTGCILTNNHGKLIIYN